MSSGSIAMDKLDCLIESIKPYKKAAVAYSGGIDSTLLLYAAKTALGADNVVALTLVSSVLPVLAVENCCSILKEPFLRGINHKEVVAEPLQWEDFVENSAERCYLCKKKMYSLLIASMADEPGHLLLDGTNVDDTKEERPGSRAIQELGVKTPLLYAGLRKVEIRKLARRIGLPNYALPSNSCLATRIATGTTIDEDLLKSIDLAETFLLKIGFSGCRVRPRGPYTIVEVQATHMEKIVQTENRIQIGAYFSSLNLGIAALSFDQR